MRLVAKEYLALDGFFHEPSQGSRQLFNEEAKQFKWAEQQTSGVQLKRMAYGGFKVLVAS